MRLIALLMVVSLALAGCTSGGDGEGTTGDPTTTSTTSTSPDTTTTTTSTGAPTTTTTTATTTAPPPGENTPPSAVLGASDPGGATPVNVTFTVDGADDDGDPLTWSLDADGDGEVDAEGTDADLPTNFTYTFDAEGNYTALLTVDDGTEQTTAEVQVAISGAGSGGYSGSGTTSTPIGNPIHSALLGAQGCASFASGENGIDCVVFDLGADLGGLTYTITSNSPSGDGEWWTACDPVAGESLDPIDNDAYVGTVPAGATCLVMWENGAQGGDYAVTIA